MKKFTSFFALLLISSFIFAQVQTVHDPNAKVTVTKEQIKAWGAASLKTAYSTAVLDFEGCGNALPIGNYYNGGGGTNYGVYFSTNSLALVDFDAGGSGNFANEPSPSTVLFFLSGSGSVMNVPAGFVTGFSFYYSSFGPSTVYVYDGLDGTGNLLATLPFPENFNVNCTGDLDGDFCHWDAVGVPFTGTAKSVIFTGYQNGCVFDDITLGSITAGGKPAVVPTLSEWGLILLGFVMLGFGSIYILRVRAA